MLALASWYSVAVTVRHAALPIACVLVLGAGVYLFVAVRAQPAPLVGAAPARPASAPDHPAARGDEPAVRPTQAPAAPPPSAAKPGAMAADDPRVYVPPIPALAGDRNLPKSTVDAIMDEANKAYDRGEYDEAKIIAARMLASFPTNVRMLRIMVSASCIDGDSGTARQHYARLPAADQEQMRTRCDRYGITFP